MYRFLLKRSDASTSTIATRQHSIHRRRKTGKHLKQCENFPIGQEQFDVEQLFAFDASDSWQNSTPSHEHQHDKVQSIVQPIPPPPPQITMEVKSFRVRSETMTLRKYTNMEQVSVLLKHPHWYKCRLKFATAQPATNTLHLHLVFATTNTTVPQSMLHVLVKHVLWLDAGHTCKCEVQFLLSTYRLGMVQIAFQNEHFPANRGIQILARKK